MEKTAFFSISPFKRIGVRGLLGTTLYVLIFCCKNFPFYRTKKYFLSAQKKEVFALCFTWRYKMEKNSTLRPKDISI